MENGSRTMMQIAESCGVRYNEVSVIVRKEHIKGKFRFENNRYYFDIHQQEIIYRILYFEGRATDFIVPSKLNTMN